MLYRLNQMRIFPIGRMPEVRQVSVAERPSLEDLRKLIEPHLDGGHLEHLLVLYDGGERDMFVDEEGALKRLPYNPEATLIYRASWLRRHPADDPRSLPAIRGPAVLFDKRVWY